MLRSRRPVPPIGPMITLFLIAISLAQPLSLVGQKTANDPQREQARNALRKSVQFFSQQAAIHGGYVYKWNEDLSLREAEGKTGVDTAWVQPPGTPSVGLALVEAYEATKEAACLTAAQAAAECLIQGQLVSGCWTDRVEFAPPARGKQAYRVDSLKPGRRFNWSTYDDDKSQSAIRFLARLDQALEFKNQRIHEATAIALDAVVRSQFPNGAWPQGFEAFPDPQSSKYPVKPASFPKTWPRKYPGGDYWIFYTFNDNSIADTIECLLLAHRIYQDERFRQAAYRAGDFILLAQMPDPQPAWAQQYNFDMHPAWARKFEPPAISGSESQGIIDILLTLYEESGDVKYLKPIPKALTYLKKSILADGRLARFYELHTNTPLYFTRNYELTSSDTDVPTHYSFKVSSQLSRLEARYTKLVGLAPRELEAQREKSLARKNDLPSAGDIQKIINSMDERGAWVEEGKLDFHGKRDSTKRIISSKTFIKNLKLLSLYLEP